MPKREASGRQMGEAGEGAAGSGGVEISAAEAKLYDRQIRVWGMEAQRRMRNASVLVVGLRGVSVEVIKNVVLAGVGQLTLLDSMTATKATLESNYFVDRALIGKPVMEAARRRIQELNPNVKVTAVSRKPEDIDAAFLSGFDAVVVSNVGSRVQDRVQSLCRSIGDAATGSMPVCVSTVSMGFFGYIFVDVGPSFKYWVKEDTDKGTDRVATGVPYAKAFSSTFGEAKASLGRSRRSHRKLAYAVLILRAFEKRYGAPPRLPADAKKLDTLRAELMSASGLDASELPYDYLHMSIGSLFRNLPPVLAVLGGMAAQEVLRVISRSGKPFNNMVLYDAHHGGAVELLLGGKPSTATRVRGQKRSRKEMDESSASKSQPDDDVVVL